VPSPCIHPEVDKEMYAAVACLGWEVGMCVGSVCMRGMVLWVIRVGMGFGVGVGVGGVGGGGDGGMGDGGWGMGDGGWGMGDGGSKWEYRV